MTDGQQRDLVVEIDEALDNHLAAARPAAFLGVGPGGVRVCRAVHRALALARAAHDGLDHAGHTDVLERAIEFLAGFREAIGGGGQPELLGGEPANTFTIHRQRRRPRRGHDRKPLGFKRQQLIRGDRLDLRDNQVRLLEFNHAAEFGTVEHGKRVRTVRHLHGGRMVVPVTGDDFHTQPLQLDHDLLAQLPGTQHEHAGRRWAEGGTYSGH